MTLNAVTALILHFYLSHSYSIQHGTDYKISLRLCVCVSVRLRALSRLHFLIDFHQNWHRRKNPQKEGGVRWGSISHHPFPYFAAQNPHFRPRGPENPCKY